jgi:DtxR family Mn-dependent transcriptional regulator
MMAEQPAPVSGASGEYLVALRNLLASGERPTTAALARRLHVTPQAASEMVRRLAGDGLASTGDDRVLYLTPEGRAVADGIFRRHALVEWLLSDVIGMGWAESDHEAHRLMGVISEQVTDALDAYLGHPETCPHGNPITAAIAAARPPGVPLSTLTSGARATVYRITEEAEEDAALLSYLQARGLRPGAAILVTASSAALGTLTLEGPRGSATLGMEPASKLHVLPGEADARLFHRVPAR